ncbi:MAG TPA: MMPL family transporter [Azospirillum sp.]|nr:MMPL family transporter [Azospirillum sp.]
MRRFSCDIRACALRWFARRVVAWRWPIVVACLAFTAVAGIGLGSLGMNPDSRVFLAEDNPDRMALERLEAAFTKDESVLIVLAPADGDVFTRENLAVVEAVTAKAWHTPHSRRVDSLANFPHSRADGDALVVEPLAKGAAALSDAALAEVRRTALSHPELVNRLVSKDGRVAAVNVTVVLPKKDPGEIPEIAAFARGLAAEIRAEHPGMGVHLTGLTMVDATFAEAGETDSATLVPLMFLVTIALVGVSARSVFGALATLAVVAMALVSALGIAGWSGLILNSASSASVLMILGLTVASCIHLLSKISHGMAHGLSRTDAIVRALEADMRPVFLTSITTVMGFLSLNLSDVPPFRDLGNIVAGGVAFGWLYAVVFFPAAIAILPVKRITPWPFERRFGDILADFTLRHHRKLLLGTVATVLPLVAGMSFITLDDNFIRYFDQRYEFRRDTDFTERALTGINVMEFALPAGGEQRVSDPAYLGKVDAFAQWLRGQEHVTSVAAITDTLKRLNQNMNGDKAEAYRVPETQELAAQYLLLYELSLPQGHDVNDRLNVDRSASRVSVAMGSISAGEMRDLADRGEAWLKENAPELWSPATGLSIVFAHVSERSIRAMLAGNALALLMIGLTMTLAERSLRVGLIALLPNLIPAAMAFGLWGFTVGEVNLAISIVLAMTFGIVVDDTIHVVNHYRGARRRGAPPADAVRHAYREAALPICITSLALVAGFGVLACSGFSVNANMGLLSAATIVFALAADLLFLPALLLKFEGGLR